MINITFADGATRQYNKGITGYDIASSISTSLAKNAIAILANGLGADLLEPINFDATVKIITPMDDEGLEILRHDTAHVLAQALKELYPNAQITIGPTIKDGFYYDVLNEDPISSDDLLRIEEQMRAIITRGEKFSRKVVSRQEAIEYFTEIGENFKVEIIKDLPENEPISLYFQGDFADLCRGPHGVSTKYIKAFKLTKVAGAYWRGNSNNVMLQRIYGTAWRTEQELAAYLHMIEEAEKRDHRKLGREMKLFHFQEEAPGVAFWHPNGWHLFQKLVNYIRQKQNAIGYQEIATPEIMDQALWHASGHWEKFKENMYISHASDDEREYAVKPMNCPGHTQVFRHYLPSGVMSYRDLPLRLSEFGKVYRYEPSGALHGLMRARGFTQDDAHVFCTEDQIIEEVKSMCSLILNTYKDFGFDKVQIKFADRPEKRVGSDETWDRSEKALIDALQNLGLDFGVNKGEGAFYGPKLEFHLSDAIGRTWQLGTVQVDLNMATRLEASYMNAEGKKCNPVMIHRAIFGSLERFIAILLEHYAGNLPLWLAPLQVAILTIGEYATEYATEVYNALTLANVKAIIDSDSETLNYKIRHHALAKIPIIIILGKKEVEEKTISLRYFGSQNQETLGFAQCVEMIKTKTQR